MGAGHGCHDQSAVRSAELGYNTYKPGRPATYSTLFWWALGLLRLVLDAVVSSGKQHTAGHAMAVMARLLEELGDGAPALIRGTCGDGNKN